MKSVIDNTLTLLGNRLGSKIPAMMSIFANWELIYTSLFHQSMVAINILKKHHTHRHRHTHALYKNKELTDCAKLPNVHGYVGRKTILRWWLWSFCTFCRRIALLLLLSCIVKLGKDYMHCSRVRIGCRARASNTIVHWKSRNMVK